MAAKKTSRAKDDKPAPTVAGDNQADGEDPFAYAARRQSELSPDSDRSTYSDSPVPNLVIQERGPAGA